MRVFSLLVLLLCVTAPSTKPVNYSANRIIFLLDQEKVILSGETKVRHRDILVTADSIEYELGTRQLQAYGNPVLHDGDETIEGEFMSYDVGKGEGTILNAKTEISRGFFEGRKIRKVADDVLNVSRGRFTTCELGEPHYYFKSWKMKIYLNDMVLCQPVVLYIQGIPVFAVPFWFFPIRKERHSGLLTPRVGRDSEEGRYIKNIAYYHVINDYADATFSLDYMQLIGYRLTVEGIYLINPWITGGLVTSLVDDRRTATRRWSVNLSHRQKWEEGYNLLLRGDFVSDLSYYREYSEDLPERMTRTLDSYVALTKSLRGSNLSIVASEKRDLEENTSMRVLPRLSFSLFPVELVKSTYFSYSGRLVNQHTSVMNSVQTAQNTARLNTKQRLWDRLNLTPSLEHSEFWQSGERRSGTSSVRIGVNANLYGMSTRRIGRIDGIRHVITPSLNYDLSLKETLVSERLRFQLRNSVQIRLVDLGKYDLFTTTTSGSYDMRENRFSPLVTGVEINPVPPFNLSCDFGYDLYDGQVDYLNETFRTFLKRKSDDFPRFNLSFTQSFLRRREEDPEVQIWGELGFDLTKNWFISYQGRYDVMKGRGVSQSVKVVRDLHCWVGELNVSWTKVRWQYDFRISIKAMPEISLKKGFFSLFLP
nr:MAG: hypothetical protein AM324_04830 [Candidatus Thorarchaeota archaeon SMTZ1-83]